MAYCSIHDWQNTDLDCPQCDDDMSSRSPGCSATGVVTEEMHIRAMKKAVELGVFPKATNEDVYLKNWAAMREILEAALSR